MIVTLEHAKTPPSLNSYQRTHWAKQRRLKAEWQGIWETLLMEADVPRNRFGRCSVSAELRFPVERRRDEGNFRTPLEKALGDACHNGRWIPDDDHDRFRFGEVRFLGQGSPLTRLILEFSEAKVAA